MYGLGEYEVIRQRHEEIRREVAANRLASKLRAHRTGEPHLLRNVGWELARYGGLLNKRIRGI